jgi:hypothetical protein
MGQPDERRAHFDGGGQVVRRSIKSGYSQGSDGGIAVIGRDRRTRGGGTGHERVTFLGQVTVVTILCCSTKCGDRQCKGF